jgi:hypothetical protein
MSIGGFRLSNAVVVVLVVMGWNRGVECPADVVRLKTGVEVQCDVLRDEPDSPLLVRVSESGQPKTYAIGRERVERIDRELPEAFGSDKQSQSPEDKTPEPDAASSDSARTPKGVQATFQGTMQLKRCSDLRPIIEHAIPDRVEGVPEIVVMHLNGDFDRPRITDIGGGISAGEFGVMFDVAMDRKPDAIVLAIDSPGGLVSEMDAIIDRLIAAQSQPFNQRVVAWVDLGGSAAALTSLACKEIVMAPQGRVGAATAVIATGEAVPPPSNAMDHKREAMRQARRTQIASLTNRPVLIQEAMEFPQRLLWAHERLGVRSAKPEEAGWTAIDASAEQPMALDASTMVRFKIAQGMAGSVEGLLGVLGLPSSSNVVHIDLKDDEIQKVVRPLQSAMAKRWACVSALDKRIEKALDQVILAMRIAQGIGADENGFVREDVYRLQMSIRCCKIPAIEHSVRRLLSDDSPDLLLCYERKLRDAKDMVRRAAGSVSQRADTLPVGDIQYDLDLARNFLIEALVGID